MWHGRMRDENPERARGDLSGKFGPVPHRPDAERPATKSLLPLPCSGRPLSPLTRAAQQDPTIRNTLKRGGPCSISLSTMQLSGDTVCVG